MTKDTYLELWGKVCTVKHYVLGILPHEQSPLMFWVEGLRANFFSMSRLLR